MYSNDLKIRAIDIYFKLNSLRKTSYLLKIGKSTIQRWISQLNFSENILNANKLNYIILHIKHLIDENSSITLKKIQLNVFNKFKRKLSVSFIFTIIRRKLKYSYKKINKKLYSGNLNDLFSKQIDFINKIKNIDKNNIIAVDETYIHTNYSHKFGWGKRGKKIIRYIKSNPIKYSIIMAVTNKKIIYFKSYKGNIGRTQFTKFIKFINKNYKKHYIVLDNVSFHKSRSVIDQINKSTNKLIYIPPYSPQFNPIEEVFSQIKRNALNINGKHVLNKFKRSIKLVESKHLKNYFNNSFN